MTMRLVSAATTNAQSMIAGVVHLSGLSFVNSGSGWAYLKLFDKASAPVLGTDTPIAVIGLPPNGGNNPPFRTAQTFQYGLAVAITGGAADADATAVALDQVAGTFFT